MSGILQVLRPQIRLWIIFLVGLVLGLVWAWVIAPVVWTDAGPVNMSDSYKKEWIKLAALQYEETADRAQAERLLIQVGDAGALFDQLINENSTTDPILAQQLTRLKEDVYTAIQDQAAATQNAANSRGGPGVPVLIVVIVAIIVIWAVLAVLLSMPLGGMLQGLLFLRGGKGASAVGGPTAETRMAGIREAQRMAETQAADYTQSELGPPIGQYMSTYLVGDDLYDDSFAVETASGEFLGETGAGISETIGIGDPKKVTAIEVWLFDKNDIRTITKVLMSEHAYHDENLRAKLAPKGEAVLAQPDAVVVLETNTLRIQARVVDLAYGRADHMPANSYFERLTLELAAWAKEGGAPVEAADAFGDTISF